MSPHPCERKKPLVRLCHPNLSQSLVMIFSLFTTFRKHTHTHTQAHFNTNSIAKRFGPELSVWGISLLTYLIDSEIIVLLTCHVLKSRATGVKLRDIFLAGTLQALERRVPFIPPFLVIAGRTVVAQYLSPREHQTENKTKQQRQWQQQR